MVGAILPPDSDSAHRRGSGRLGRACTPRYPVSGKGSGGEGLRRSVASRLAFAGLIGGLAILLSGCDVFSSPQNTFGPEGEVAKDQKFAFMITMWPALAIMLFVELGLLFMMIRFRQRKGHEALPKQIHGNNVLEIGWTIAPALLLAAFVPFVVAGIVKLGDPPSDSLVVDVYAQRFSWYFEYPGPDGESLQGDLTSTEVYDPGLYIPVDRNIELRLHSTDVIHSFWVPKLAGKTDVIPGRTNHMWLKGDKIGVYSGQCAEFCGLSHAYMRFNTHVVSQETYDRYIGCLAATAEQPGEGCDDFAPARAQAAGE